MTEELPVWILSSYSPTPDTPRQLFGGAPREQSFEEIRLRHYELARAGQEQQAVQEAGRFYDSAEQQIRTALNDLNGAIKYIVDGKNDHPNRIDICKETTRTGVLQRNADAPSQSQPSAQTRGSAFGQASQLGQASAFGQPSMLSKPQNPFASTSNSQPSFGRPSQLGGNPAPALGQPSNPFAQARDATSIGFGHPSTPGPVFGGASSMDTSPVRSASLGQGPTLLGSAATPTNPFAVKQSIPSLQPITNGVSPSSSFPTSTSALSAGASGVANAQKNPQGRLVSWNGRQISYIEDQPCYRRADGSWERVWFPDPPKLDLDEQLPTTMYGGDTEARYRYMQEHGAFQDGLMPDLPPRKEWCNWNF